MPAYDKIMLPSMDYGLYRRVIMDIRKLNDENVFPPFNVGYVDGNFYVIFFDKQAHLMMTLAGDEAIVERFIDKSIYECL